MHKILELIQTSPLILVGPRDQKCSNFFSMQRDSLKKIHYCPKLWVDTILTCLGPHILVTASASSLWLWYSQSPQEWICWRNSRVHFTSTPSKSSLKVAFHIPQFFAAVASATIFCHTDPISGTLFSTDCHP